MDLLIFDSLGSTNRYCELLDLSMVGEFTVVYAREQTAGIGQRGNCWHSAPGLNLTFSFVLKPVFLAVGSQYMLTKAISLGIVDWLATVLPAEQPVDIKWPNDIYVGGNKICGVLVSNRLQRGQLAASIVGVGININQTVFPDWVPNPTSVKLITGKELNLEESLKGLVGKLEARYRQLHDAMLCGSDILDREYLSLLLNYGEECTYLYHDKEVKAAITGVNQYGHLELLTAGGDRLVCQMKELQFTEYHSRQYFLSGSHDNN